VTPERWERVGSLYAAASELPTERRADFLRDACGDDHALRDEVASLLASGEAAGAFLNSGAIADAAKIVAHESVGSLVGRTLDHYEVVSLVGSGGMGEVYRAHDSRLGRDVAIKVLPELVTQSDDARRRFVREAQAVAALSHPNVRSLYDVGETDGHVYAVMELLEGETLRARLARGPLPVQKAIETGAAIADGLAAAHARGIVHRDIKPENIFIGSSGHVKVLDFGLAKMPDAPGAGANAETATGIVLGTAGYMSPEQVAGHAVDARSDIFSFGCVLYEMLAGRRAFARRTSAETMTAVLNDEPPPLEAAGAGVRRIVSHCLEKQPEARFQSAQDLAFHLRSQLNLVDTEKHADARTDRRRLWPALAALFTIATVVLSLVHFRQAASPVRPVRFDVQPPEHLTFSGGAFALSPDGARLAFVTASGETPGHRRLWIHAFDTGEAQQLSAAGDVGGNALAWSPDGRKLAFVAEGSLRTIALSGGSPTTLAPAVGVSTWSADDVIMFLRDLRLMKVSAAGGSATPLTTPDPAHREVHYAPQFLPDGRHFLFSRSSVAGGTSGVLVGSIDARPEQQNSRPLLATHGRAAYAPSRDDAQVGHLVFNREGTLWAQPFDAGRLELTGDPILIAEHVGEPENPQRPGFFSVSRAGALAYRRQPTVSGIPVWLEANGRTTTPLLDSPVTGSEQIRLSPDGHRYAMTIAGDIWVYDLGGRPPIRLTSGGGNDMPLWTPDGKRIVYARGIPSYRLVSVPADVAGATPEPVSPDGHFHPHGWSRDGRELIAVLNTYSSATGWDILGIPVGEKGEPRIIVGTASDEGQAGAALSPDGRWLAYTSNVTGASEIWVQPYPGPGSPILVSPHGGMDPHWAPNGRNLYYLENRKLMAVAVDVGKPAFTFTPAAFLFDIPAPAASFPVQSYDVAKDGRFIMGKAVSTGASSPITVILNWAAALTK